MASRTSSFVCCVYISFVSFLSLGLVLLNSAELVDGQSILCPDGCACLGKLVDCSQQKLKEIPGPIHSFVEILHLQGNNITTIPDDAFVGLVNLKELNLANNNLSGEVNVTSFQGLRALRELNLARNKLTVIPALDPYTGNLTRLVMSNNQISEIPGGVLELSIWPNNLHHLDLSRNQIRAIPNLIFKKLRKLEVLIISRNRINQLDDGAFWGLENLEQLHLDYNEIGSISKGWLFGLNRLRNLQLEHNNVNSLDPEGWKFCTGLETLDLAYNELSMLEVESFSFLTELAELALNHNSIASIADSAFQGLSSLQTLDLSHNNISWTIEDMTGAFEGLESLMQLNLAHNQIKSIARKAFTGLENVQLLDLRQNFITSIQNNAFSNMEGLTELLINSSSMLCDCQLEWFPDWITQTGYRATVQAECAHPEVLREQDIFQVESDDFTCDDHPQLFIVRQPETVVALRSDNVSLICTAASSSDTPVQFAWKKDNKVMSNMKMLNFESQGEGNREFTTVLSLSNIQDEDQGRYQCVISNQFGSIYSRKAKVTVHVFPSFLMTPSDVKVKVGEDAMLRCAAQGSPIPEIAWQKDAGENFPAAHERRFNVMKSKVFYIVDVKLEDMGIYSCTASNDAGIIIANATVTVLDFPRFIAPLKDVKACVGETAVMECKVGGSPRPKITWLKDGEELVPSDDILVVEGGTVLILNRTKKEDSGTYTCKAYNALGVEKDSANLILVEASHHAMPDKMTTGVIIIAVICCVMGTSLIWVLVIYHTRKRADTSSAGLPPHDPVLPPKIPSSAFNGSSEATIHQETSFGVSSAATDKYQGDNASDCDSLDSATQQHMSVLPGRGPRTAAVFPNETDMEGIQHEDSRCPPDIDNDGPDDILNSSDHLYPDMELEAAGDDLLNMELPAERPGHQSSDNAISKTSLSKGNVLG